MRPSKKQISLTSSILSHFMIFSSNPISSNNAFLPCTPQQGLFIVYLLLQFIVLLMYAQLLLLYIHHHINSNNSKNQPFIHSTVSPIDDAIFIIKKRYMWLLYHLSISFLIMLVYYKVFDMITMSYTIICSVQLMVMLAPTPCKIKDTTFSIADWLKMLDFI